MKRYYALDLRKLAQNPIDGCKFHLHEPSIIMSSSINPLFEQQEDDIKLDEYSNIFTSEYRCPEIYTAIIDNCVISPRAPNLPRYWGLFFQNYYAFNFLSNDAKKEFSKNNYFQCEDNIIYADLNQFSKTHIQGTSVWFYSFKNLDHLLRECLPSLINIKKLGYDLNDLKFICPELPKDAIDLFNDFGIPKENIISLDNVWLSFDKLIVPCFSSFGHLHTPTKYYTDVLDYGKKCNGHIKRFYISRKNAKERRIINENILFDDLQERGFEIVEPGNYSKSQQRELFSNAEIIIGPHGMGIANAVFSKDLTLLIEIMNTDYNRVSYFRTAQLRNAQYGAYYIKPLKSDFNPKNNRFGDVLINRSKFLMFLDFMISKIKK
ncbi:glycosyltransferase family 61 protein [Neisseria montereyensis]|uniref:Glycosyltransferase family 61 protein n=1 Tax=Neisseria montereyensis TaxID=2973938 RepID=A0ABT2FE92_9NEIS|nr:glycosyltransferase family 61 protein [Neisseria montereyensis]MCS4534531.1 glycosyltransferase family 61 protein [Neisseria montereyensis]